MNKQSRQGILPLLILMTLSFNSHANDIDCLSSIMYSEARGESIEGAIAVGEATVNRAAGSSICKVQGVTKKTPPATLAPYYRAISKDLLAKSSNITLGADGWDTGLRPRKNATITRRIGKHTFYKEKT